MSHAQGGVQVRQRFVEQEGRGFAHDGAADGDALALAARQLAGPAVKIVRQVQHLGGMGHAAVLFGLVHARHLQRKGDVLAHRHVRVKRVGLEHHGQAALGGRQVGRIAAVDLDRARGGILKPRDQAQQGGLAAARRADEDDEFAVSMVRSSPGMTSTSPNDLRTLVSSILPIGSSLHRAEGQAADQLLLAEPAKDQDRQDGHGEAAESFAQNRPCGLPNEAMKADSGAALVVVSTMVQNASFQARMTFSSSVEAMPGTAIGVRTWTISFHRTRRPSARLPGSRRGFRGNRCKASRPRSAG
jgi:hypothetical protein